ncbi:MAG: hypothetical protein ACI84O_000344 [Myxococcota bacterium]|jgi:hypothetical protein
MTESVPNSLANAAAHCLLGDLSEAGLEFIPQHKTNSGYRQDIKDVRVLFLGAENDQSANSLLIAIASKGLGIDKDFAHMNLLKNDSQTIESAVSNYNAEIIIVLGAENAISLFPGHDSPTSLQRGCLLQSSYSTTPILITESLNAMLSNPELKKSCWEDLQVVKVILNN